MSRTRYPTASLALTRRGFHTMSAAAGLAVLASAAQAHHGWSSFDLNRPIWLSGKATKVAWRNPHAELALEVDSALQIPPDLAQRKVPNQVASVDGARLLAAATLPKRRDKVWQVELAPLTRMEAWKVPEIANGDNLGVLGFTFQDERGDAILRVEYLFLKGQIYGLRSGPA